MRNFEYRPVPVEQLEEYLVTSEGHEHTFHPATLIRNAVAELLAIKKNSQPVGVVRYVDAGFKRPGIHVSVYDTSLPDGAELFTAPQPALIVPNEIPAELSDQIIDICDGFEVGDSGAQEIWNACRSVLLNGNAS